MKKLLALSLAAFVAGPNLSFAADEKKPEAAPTLQSPQTAPSLPEAKQLNADDTKALEEIGTQVFGVKWTGKLVAVSVRGFQVATEIGRASCREGVGIG